MKQSKTFPKKTKEDIVLDTLIYLILAIVFFFCIYPFYFAVVLSFNDGVDAARGGIYFYPRQFTLENYVALFTDNRWINSFFITVVRTIIGTVVTTGFTALVAYGLSFKELVFRKAYMWFVIVCMYFNGGLIPYYITLRTVGLINNFWVYIIPQALNLFYLIVSISFFQELPRELNESAKLDGAGELTIFTRIVLPLSKPLLATVAIFSAVTHWNSWFDAAFFIQDSNLRPMGYLLVEIINKSQANPGAGATVTGTVTPLATQVTAMVVAVLPIIVVYPFMQRYFITGLTMGSVKG